MYMLEITNGRRRWIVLSMKQKQSQLTDAVYSPDLRFFFLRKMDTCMGKYDKLNS